MGRVIQLKGKKHQGKLPVEGSKEEEVIVSELYKKLMSITDKYHEVVVCKAVATFMGTMMMKADSPGMVIGGFMKHIQAVANIAIAQHQHLEKLNAPKVYGTKHSESENPAQSGQSWPSDPGPTQGGDRGVEEQEGQEILFPPTLQ